MKCISFKIKNIKYNLEYNMYVRNSLFFHWQFNAYKILL